MLIAFSLPFWLGWLFEEPSFLKCPNASGGDDGEDACLSTSVVLRMSSVLAFFHLCIILVIGPRAQCSRVFHDGCWCLKICLLIAIFIGTFFIDNDVYRVYSYVAKTGSTFFLIIQTFLILIGAYTISDFFADSNTGVKVFGIFIILLFTVGSIILMLF